MKKLLLVLLGVIFGFLIFFVGFEFYLRMTGHFELQRFYNAADTEHGFTQHMRSDKRKRFRPSPYPGLGWELDPLYPPLNAHDRFIDQKIRKDKGVYRIIAIGDSVTQQGYYEKFLEEMLNDSNLGRKFEIWNCGVGAYHITQYYYYLKHKGIRFNPDMIIVGFTIGDIGQNPVILMTKDGYKAFYNPFTYIDVTLNRYLFLRSRTYRYLVYNLEKILKIKRSEQIPYVIFNDLIDLARSKDIKILVLIFPYLKNRYNDWELNQYNSIRAIVKEANVPYVDLHNSFDNRDLPTLRDDPQDYVHPSEEAFKIMALDIYNFLMNNFDFNKMNWEERIN